MNSDWVKTAYTETKKLRLRSDNLLAIMKSQLSSFRNGGRVGTYHHEKEGSFSTYFIECDPNQFLDEHPEWEEYVVEGGGVLLVVPDYGAARRERSPKEMKEKQRKYSLEYYRRVRDDPEYKERRRKYSKEYYRRTHSDALESSNPESVMRARAQRVRRMDEHSQAMGYNMTLGQYLRLYLLCRDGGGSTRDREMKLLGADKIHRYSTDPLIKCYDLWKSMERKCADEFGGIDYDEEWLIGYKAPVSDAGFDKVPPEKREEVLGALYGPGTPVKSYEDAFNQFLKGMLEKGQLYGFVEDEGLTTVEDDGMEWEGPSWETLMNTSEEDKKDDDDQGGAEVEGGLGEA